MDSLKSSSPRRRATEAPQGHHHEQHYNFIAQGKEVIMTGESWIHPIGLPMENLIRLAHRFVFHRGKLVLLEDVFDTMSGKKSFKK